MKFRKDNKIKYGQVNYGQVYDFHRGIPSGIEFVPTLFNTGSHLGVHLEAPGYGRLGDYGHGKVVVVDRRVVRRAVAELAAVPGLELLNRHEAEVQILKAREWEVLRQMNVLNACGHELVELCNIKEAD